MVPLAHFFTIGKFTELKIGLQFFVLSTTYHVVLI